MRTSTHWAFIGMSSSLSEGISLSVGVRETDRKREK